MDAILFCRLFEDQKLNKIVLESRAGLKKINRPRSKKTFSLS